MTNNLWRQPHPLVLASQSRIRRSLLEGAGIPVEARPAAVDERALQERMGDASAPEVAARLAAAKAGAVSQDFPGRLVLGADQTLECEGRIFSKAKDREEARVHLRALCGRTHELHSAVAVMVDGREVFRHVATARLVVRSFSNAFLEEYLDAAGGAALASVGGYQLESIGAQLFERIDGDYFTILGLPLLPVLGFLREAGYLAR